VIDANPDARPDTVRPSDTRELSGDFTVPIGKADDNSGDTSDSKSGEKRGARRKPRQLMDKDIGNVVEGQRNMPEILSPCG
jgi:hypothetical protein